MTRIEDREDDELLYDLGGTEHPTFLFLDAAGEVLGRHDPGDTSVKALEETGAKVKRSLDLRKKAEAGDAGARVDLAIVRCELGLFEFSDLQGELEGAALTPEQERAVGALKADATVSDMWQVLKKNRDEAAKSLVAEEFLALYAKGKHPARRGNRRFYWNVLAGQGVARKDPAILGAALEGLRAVAGATPSEREVQALRELEEKLKELAPAK